MVRVAVMAGLTLVPLFAGPVPADPVTLRDGAYAVEVKLELPHLEDMTQKAVRQVCLRAEPGANTHGLAVLSDNNPLARCPLSDIREEAGVLTFAIACDGKNAARATARYVLAPERFQGRITMQMGGKNMTMTEVQTGRRIGVCEGAKAPGP
ncbi:DUF3617 domain-containing protein [Methylobacterium haplocladii]|uniref:DUF3617 domain-containing protein n=1 Tax=Methylobacterium haplocladii TaxID=1176176 RepID=A0A512ISN7_9HYPH|nr:DUF3617 family protein [Methylobacterium haplocladii]GEP00686.1 hypothetical protein MHA02_30730 [Methylobacterium haplocladii]GJD82378.1 hypothetical protein HPGCJGGD_0232 [Methylobacterium haplocladii]GLS60792.1 hypothetical protein GCM10007887_34800 [Methylobacterium haplocladii]